MKLTNRNTSCHLAGAALLALAATLPARADNYQAAVLAQHPVGYWRLNEASDPVATNLGSLGAAANGAYVYAAQAGVPGPRSPTYAGFEANNLGVNFNGANGYVTIPALGLNTNSVTLTAWVKANGSQEANTALVICDGGTTGGTGLAIDLAGGLQLAYQWNGDPAATRLPSALYLPDSDWAFIAMAVQPDQCALYLGAANDISSFSSFVNTMNHVVQAFDAPLQIGADASALVFNGVIDEVTVFNRTLTQGEVYSEYAAAIGGIGPTIFADPQSPPYLLYTGDTLTLTVDAGGTPTLAYQWRKNGSNIPGANGSAYTMSPLAVTNNGNYDVVVTNLYGAAPSGPASITVNAANLPSISQGPQGRTLYAGGTLNLSVVAAGGGLKYQWSKDNTPIANATNSTYVVASVTTGDAGVYTVTATNGLGSASAGPATITIPASASGSYEAAIVADAPEAWWRLDEASGSTTMWDAMGRHDGYYTNVSGNPVTLGAAGALFNDADTAVSFDGSASYGVVPFSSKLNGRNFTLECWARTTDLTEELCPVSSSFSSKGEWFFSGSGPDYSFPSGSWNGGVYSDGLGYFVPSTVAADAVVSGQWTHLVMTDDGSWIYVYINGEWDGDSYYDFDRNDSGPLVIGALGNNAGSPVVDLFKGQVDEVAVYTKALSQARIQAHYQARYGNNTVAQFGVPLAPQTITPGRSVTFSTTVAGSLPIALQWYKGANAINGATSPTLTVNDAVTTDIYTLWATNPAGVSSISVTLTVVPAVSFVNDTNGLVLHLKFEGDANDSSGRGNNGTRLGNPTFVTGKIGSQALHYSTATAGTNVTSASYVSLGTPADLQFGTLTSFSASMWVRLPAGYVGNDLPFFDSATNSANNLGFTFSPSYGTGGWEWCLQDGLSGAAGTHDFDINGLADSINDGAWHHFLLTVDRGANLAITYLDGLRVSAVDITGLGSFDSGWPIIIGQDPTGAYPEAGSADIDDLGVWLRALTAGEVCDIYSAGSTAGHSFDTVASPSVTITLARTPTGFQLSWPNGTLFQSSSLTGTWLPVPGATAPSYSVTPSEGRMFYRVQVQ
ncbi:MAG: LamG-like jellyroll fold domain-containing protein [Verrucomicrobiota bacterium]|jgi:hypothetical protein